jgi:hypothetical protein
MLSFKPVLAAAAIAFAVPLAVTSPSLAQGRGHAMGGGHMGHGGGGHMGMHMGGGHMHMGGHMGGGGWRHVAGGGWHGGGWHGGGHRGGGWHGGHRHGGGFFPGFLAGSAIGFGSAFASPYYYGDPYGYYDAYGYYDDGPTVEVVPGGGDVAYCQRRFKSYDVRSGTYLGYDGLRHSCP